MKNGIFFAEGVICITIFVLFCVGVDLLGFEIGKVKEKRR
jgi:hypothetical protein